MAQLSANYGLALTNPDTMPHDLWPAVILPPLDLADQLTLLAAGFDRTFEIDENGHTWQFVPIPEQVEVSLGRRAIDGLTCEETVKRMREAAPDAKITVQGKRINVTALIEDHERIMMAMVAARQASEKADMAKEVQGGANAAEAAELVRHRINLKVANARLGVLLNHVAKQLELRFEYDESIAERNISLDQRVTIDVSAATVDEFFTAVLQDTGLTFRRQGKVVQILVAP